MALTTVFLFRQHVGTSLDSTVNTKLVALIDSASAAIESFLGRTIGEATYRSWLDGNDSNTLYLPEWPITQVKAVAVGSVSAATITGAGFKYATVEVDQVAGLIRFFSVDTSGTETTTEKAFATYKTLTTLAAVAPAGWTFTITSGYGDTSTLLIKPFTSEYAVSPDDVSIDVADDAVPCAMDRETNRGIRRMMSSGFIADNAVFARNNMDPVFPVGYANVFAWYKAGYTLPVDAAGNGSLSVAGNVPTDLTHVCNVCVKAMYDMADQETGADSSSIDGYSYSLGAGNRGILEKTIWEHRSILSPHRRIEA
jgi:hypothetical protein